MEIQEILPGLGILLILGAATLIIYRQRSKSGRRRLQKRRRQSESKHIVENLTRLGEPRHLATGNEGSVYIVWPHEGWEDETGVFWKWEGPAPERMAMKLVRNSQAVKRRESLKELAILLEAQRREGSLGALCPFVALGEIPSFGASDESCLVEFMPFIEGDSLKNTLKRKELRGEPWQILDECLALLKTVENLSQNGWFSRNLDMENVIVKPDGHWIRIDFDNAVRRQEFPIRGMTRLARLSGNVLEYLKPDLPSEEPSALLETLRQTERAPLKHYENSPLPRELKGKIISSPKELMTRIMDLKNHMY